MDFREIIVGLGIIAIAVIVWDGTRRMKAAKPKKPIVKDDWVDPEEEARKAELARELPNGGARIRTMTTDEQVEIKSKLNLRERVPMLMERVEVESPQATDPEEQVAKALQSELDFTAAMSDYDDEPVEPVAKNRPSAHKDRVVHTEENTDQDIDDDIDSLDETPKWNLDLADDDYDATAEPTQKTGLDDQDSARAVAAQPEAAHVQPETEAAADLGPVEDLVIVHVMAPNDGELSGSLLLDLLITAGLRHGPMNIFHYRNPQGITEFSLANCIHPGTFDPDAMNQVNTPGVTLFMQLPTAADALESFDHMIEMARFLAKHLEAVILDEDHSSVTGQRIEYYREKIRAFERSKLIPS